MMTIRGMMMMTMMMLMLMLKNNDDDDDGKERYVLQVARRKHFMCISMGQEGSGG